MYTQFQGTFLSRGKHCLFYVTGTPQYNKLYSSLKGSSKGSERFSAFNSDVSSGAASTKQVHASAVRSYPLAEALPLPVNIEDINATKKARFSPQRNRDISGPVILSKFEGTFRNGFVKRYNRLSQPVDPHIGSYDCTGPVSMHASMQTNVPEPFSSNGKATHLNMPGGQWGQDHKYISDDMQNTHYRNIVRQRNPRKEDSNKGKPVD